MSATVARVSLIGEIVLEGLLTMISTRRYFALICVIGGGASIVAFGQQERSLENLSTEERDAARQAVASWLECEECTDEELAAVLEIRTIAFQPLAAALRQGPSAANIAKNKHALEKRLGRMERSGADFGPDVTAENVADQYIENYKARYRIHAAFALRRIGGAQALAVLEEASRNDVIQNGRQDVQRAVADAVWELREAAR